MAKGIEVQFFPPAPSLPPVMDLAPLAGPQSPWPFAHDLHHHAAGALKQTARAVAALKGAEQLAVVGIGGSALGARSLCQALGVQNVVFLENADAHETRRLIATLPLKKLAIHAVSKSGGTTETLLNLHRLVSALEQAKVKDWGRRLVVTCDPPGQPPNPFAALAGRVGGQVLPMTPAVGGRFSVFTPVGLLPLLFAGGDGGAFVKGARQGLVHAATGHWDGLFAGLWGQAQKGRDTLVYMPYHNRLEALGEWVVQLISESLGKQKGRRRVGVTPVRALGSRDQHSYLQLLQDGPRDKQVMILTARQSGVGQDTPGDPLARWPEFPALLRGKTLHEVQLAQAQATAQALSQDGVPVWWWRWGAIDEWHVGYHNALWMTLTAALGRLMGVDPFDQPGVEASKKATARILAGY